MANDSEGEDSDFPGFGDGAFSGVPGSEFLELDSIGGDTDTGGWDGSSGDILNIYEFGGEVEDEGLAVAVDFDFHFAVEEDLDDALEVLEAVDFLTIYGDDLVSWHEAGAFGGGVFDDGADDCGGCCLSYGEEKEKEDDDCEDEISHWPGEDDCESLTDSFVVEGSGSFFIAQLSDGSARPIFDLVCVAVAAVAVAAVAVAAAVVGITVAAVGGFVIGTREDICVAEHFDISPDWEEAEFPSGSEFIGESDELGTHPDGEGVDFDSVPPGDEVVAEFVDEHQNGDDQEKGQKEVEDEVDDSVHGVNLLMPRGEFMVIALRGCEWMDGSAERGIWQSLLGLYGGLLGYWGLFLEVLIGEGGDFGFEGLYFFYCGGGGCCWDFFEGFADEG